MEKLADCSTFSGYSNDNAKKFLSEFMSYALLHDLHDYDGKKVAAFHPSGTPRAVPQVKKQARGVPDGFPSASKGSSLKVQQIIHQLQPSLINLVIFY